MQRGIANLCNGEAAENDALCTAQACQILVCAHFYKADFKETMTFGSDFCKRMHSAALCMWVHECLREIRCWGWWVRGDEKLLTADFHSVLLS